MPGDNSETIAPVRKTVCVKGGVDTEFHWFTSGINGWWPLITHSVSLNDAVGCAIEGRVGGRLFERERTGKELVWGTVTVWDPPNRVAFTWHPGHDADSFQELDIRFSDIGSGITLVELTHSGWERLGANGAAIREIYEKGWDFVLGECYAHGRSMIYYP